MLDHPRRKRLLPGLLFAALLLFFMGQRGLPAQERYDGIQGRQHISDGTITATINGTDSWRRGKIQRPRTAITGQGLAIVDGYRRIKFYETDTYRLAAIDTLTVNATIPRPGSSTVTVRVITSSNHRFSHPNGSYHRAEEMPFNVSDGFNRFSVGNFSNTYFRIHVSMHRRNTSVPSPILHTISFTGQILPGAHVGAKANQ